VAVQLAKRTHQLPKAVAARRLGAWLVIVGFVLSQFVEFTVSNIGGFDISVQKLVALAVFPAAFILIGHIRFSRTLVTFAILMILANSAAYAVGSDISDPELLSANVVVLIGFLGATLLFTALSQDRREFATLGRVWAVFAAISSLIVIGQVGGILPLWAVSGEALGMRAAEAGSLYRGTGLRFDPNYEALALVIGLVFARFYMRRIRFLTILLIMLGIAGTFSRMGFIAAALILVTASPVQAWVERKAFARALIKALGYIVSLITISIGFYMAVPDNIRSYINLRVAQLSGVIHTPVYEGTATGITSAEERVWLLHAAVQVISQHFAFGVGAYREPEFLYYATGVDKTAHNTYLEAVLIGGVIGIFALCLYIFAVTRALYRSRLRTVNPTDRSSILMVVYAFAFMAAFLTMNYNSILWFPLVITLAYAESTSPNRRKKQHASP